MSAQALAVAFGGVAPAVAKLCLIRLADHINDDGLSQLDLDDLSRFAGCSPQRVESALRALERRRLIIRAGDFVRLQSDERRSSSHSR